MRGVRCVFGEEGGRIEDGDDLGVIVVGVAYVEEAEKLFVGVCCLQGSPFVMRMTFAKALSCGL